MGKKRSILLITVLALCMACSGIAFAEEDESSITIGITEDPGDISPFGNGNGGNIRIMRTLYETLLDTNAFTGTVEGVLAKDWEAIDAETYEVELYDYIYDQAGNHFTAEDVKFCYDTAYSMKPGQMGSYESCEVIDDYTVRFHLSEGNTNAGSFESLMQEIYMVTEAAYEADATGMTSSVCSTSPYVLTNYTTGSSVSCEKGDSYWQTDESLVATFSQTNVDEITWTVIPESAQVSIALEMGTIDGAGEVDSADLVNFINDDGTAKEGYTVTSVRDNQIYRLLFNCRDGITADENFRKAISYCIDAASATSAVLGNTGEVAKNYGNENYSDYDADYFADLDYFEYDEEYAKELLAQTDYNGETITLLTVEGETRENMAVMIQAYCSAIGINVEINAYDNSLYRTMVESDEGDWSLALNSGGSNEYLINVVEGFSSDKNAIGIGIMLTEDEDLNELIKVADDPTMVGKENTTAVLEYIQDKCYAYAICSYYDQIITDDKFEEAAIDFRSSIIPGASIYAK